MIYLVLAVLASTMVSVVMRLSTGKVKNNMSMLAANYVVCTALSAVNAGGHILTPAEALPATLGMGVINGILYLLAFLLLHYNMKRNGVVLASTFMKLGLLVSMAVSVIFFREMPGVVQWIGFAIAIGAIILINYEKGGKAGSKWSLLLLLLAGGSCDAMAKIYEEVGAANLSAQFLFYTFVVAFLLCLGLAIWKKEAFGKRELLFGLLIGIPNFYSARFLLASMRTVPAVIAYPTFSVGTILTVTLAGVLFFREKLKPRQWIALAVILGALVLLNI